VVLEVTLCSVLGSPFSATAAVAIQFRILRLRVKVKGPLYRTLMCKGEERYIALPFRSSWHYKGVGCNATPRPPYPWKRPGTNFIGWAPASVWTDAENLAPTGIRSPDRPARSESLYRLRHPGLHSKVGYCRPNSYSIYTQCLYEILSNMY
jgi:hypothetical protein